MAASITVHLQIFKRPLLPQFSTHFDKNGIKIHGLLRSFILNIVIIRVAVPFKMGACQYMPITVRKLIVNDNCFGGHTCHRIISPNLKNIGMALNRLSLLIKIGTI